MTFTNNGYDGDVDEVAWALMSRYFGSLHGVLNSRGSMTPSIVGTATRTVKITSGTAYAHGVRTNSSADELVTFADVTTLGFSRWDAVVLRRAWGSNTSSFEVVQGVAAAGAPKVVPSGVNNNPGVTHDQLIALVQITQGQSVPTDIEDMRYWGSKTYSAKRLAALPPAASDLYGTEFILDSGARYRCTLDQSSSYVWAPVAGITVEYLGTAVMTVTTSAGWSGASPIVIRALKTDNLITLDFRVRRSGAAIAPTDVQGNFPDTQIGQLVTALRPDLDKPVPIQYWGTLPSTQGWLPGMAALGTDGRLSLQSGVNGGTLVQRNSAADITAGSPSIRGHITYQRKVA